MAAFIATFSNPNGQQRTLTINASNLTDAKKQLRRRGIRVEKLEPIRSKSTAGSKINQNKQKSFDEINFNNLFENEPGIKDKAVFASKMAALIDAGVPIVRSLELMASQQKLPMFKRALTAVSSDVNEGISLATALRRWPKVFDHLTIAMVEAGEAGVVLDDSLKRLSKLLEDNFRLQNQIKGALSYPIIVLVVAILVFFGMTIFIIPIFADIFQELGAELPFFTILLLNLSELLRSSFTFYAIGVIAIAIWAFTLFYRNQKGRRIVDRLILKLPLFGELILLTATAQFCRIFSSLTRAGVPILLSMDITSETTGNKIVSDAINTSTEMIREGALLSEALITTKVFPEMALNMLKIGEETGEMDKMLSKVADFYEDEVGTTTKALTSLLEPMMIVFVGGIVGSILIAMYLPMFSVFNAIS